MAKTYKIELAGNVIKQDNLFIIMKKALIRL